MRTITFKAFENKYVCDIENQFELKELSLSEVKEMLSKVVGNYAYWSGLVNKLKRAKTDLDIKYSVWFADLYVDVHKRNLKKTETYLKQIVILENKKEWIRWQKVLARASYAQNQCNVIVKSYELQEKTLRSMSYTAGIEFNQLVKEEGGSLDDT